MRLRAGPAAGAALAGVIALLSVLASCQAPASRTGAAPPGPPPPVSAQADPFPASDREGWLFPVAGAVLPARESQMPNAPRDYRGGTHEGVDIYGRADGSNLACGQEVLNARTGWIVRADHEWKTMVLREYEGLTAALKTEENPSYLDRLRGRQVWVRTDDGAVVRYCHLSAIDEGVQVGLKVEQGMRLGAVGNTGTYDGSLGANRNCHLHFEVWPAPEAFLGKGRKPREALALYSRLFETAPK